MASKQVIILAKRIRDEFGIDVDPESFCRTRAGHIQREAGAYSWIIQSKVGVSMIGSGEPIRKCIVKRNRIDLLRRSYCNWEFELFAYQPGEPGYEKCNVSDEDVVAHIKSLHFNEKVQEVQ